MAPRRTTATKRRRMNSPTVNPPPLPTLPFDLVVEILYRVPAKPLLQFKSVSKSWKSLISDSKFTKKHLHVSTSRHNLLFRRLYKNEYIINACPLSSLVTKNKGVPTATATRQLEYPPTNRISDTFDKIHGSCHGILCIKLYQSSVILWNPSIRKFTRLPSLGIPGTNPETNAMYPSFGYDDSSDSYKVVAFSYTVSGVKAHVHTMGTNSWRRIQDAPRLSFNSESGKFVSGTLNWLAYNDSSIVSLDLETESYQELLLPDYGEVDVLSKSLWVLRDCLCILSSHTGDYSEIWLMKEYGNKDSWTKLFDVPNMELGHPYTRALYVYEDDQVLLEFRSKLVVYNSRDGTFKTLKVQKRRGWMIPEVYQESLISPCF